MLQQQPGRADMKTKENKKKKVNHLWIIISVILVAAAAAVVLGSTEQKESEKSVLEELKEKQGYLRTVGSEEYEFYKKLVYRDSGDGMTEEELDEAAREKVNRVNAEFMLANQMGLCDPYSFESFQRDMENENTQRKLKKEKEEVFYGPEKFDLISYYNYVSGNLKLDMVSFITENADAKVMDGARTYFETHSENYKTIQQINYEMTENGTTETCVLKREEMSTLEKTDSALFEFLYYGAEKDTFQYSYNESERTVQIISIEYEELSFNNNMERVMRDYITNVYLEDWIQQIEEENPVDFNLS